MLAGSIWVDGNYLYYITASGTKYRGLGVDLGTKSGSAPGSIWMESDYLMYIDSSSKKRRLPRTTITSTLGVEGSLWVEGNWIYIVNSSLQKLQVHQDHTNHSDEQTQNWNNSTEHSDVQYQNWTNYADSNHTDNTHYDWNDVGRTINSHGDQYADWWPTPNVYWVDRTESFHNDNVYTDGWVYASNHYDAIQSNHNDTAYSDTQAYTDYNNSYGDHSDNVANPTPV